MHKELKDWLTQGRQAGDIPSSLSEHLRSCKGCNQEWQEILSLRDCFPDGTELPKERSDAIYERLMAEARGKSLPEQGRTKKKPEHKLLLLWTCAAIPTLAIAALLVWLDRPSEKFSTDSALFASRARVQAEANALVWQVSEAPDEVYQLSDGSVRFDVSPLGSGHRLRVVVGKSIVEVRGTRFELTANRGDLVSLQVMHGVVAVSFADGRSQIFREGQSWHRTPNSTMPSAAGSSRNPSSAEDERSSFAVNTVVKANEQNRNPAPKGKQSNNAKLGSRKPKSAHGNESKLKDGTLSIAPGGEQEFHRVWQLVRANDYRAAAPAMDALAKHPDLSPSRRSEVYYWAGVSRHKLGQNALAIARLKKAIALAPEGWHVSRARLLLSEIENAALP